MGWGHTHHHFARAYRATLQGVHPRESSSPWLAHGLTAVTGPVRHGGGSAGRNLAAHVPANLPWHEPQPSLCSLRRQSPMDPGTGNCHLTRGVQLFLNNHLVATSPWKMNPLSALRGSSWVCRTGAFCTTECVKRGTYPALGLLRLRTYFSVAVLQDHRPSSSALSRGVHAHGF